VNNENPYLDLESFITWWSFRHYAARPLWRAA